MVVVIETSVLDLFEEEQCNREIDALVTDEPVEFEVYPIYGPLHTRD